MHFSLLGLWRARRARKAAVSAITPLVNGSRIRLGVIGERVWLEPYMIGFIVMLVSLIARREVPGLDQQWLGLIQAEAWAEITGLQPELVGEQVVVLSLIRHQHFMTGCHDAADVDILMKDPTRFDDVVDDHHIEGQTLQHLWQDTFDNHVCAVSS